MLNNHDKLIADLVERAASRPCYDASRELKGHRYVELDTSRTLSHPYNIRSTYARKNHEEAIIGNESRLGKER